MPMTMKLNDLNALMTAANAFYIVYPSKSLWVAIMNRHKLLQDQSAMIRNTFTFNTLLEHPVLEIPNVCTSV